MTVNFNAIPEELRSRPQWVLWRWLERPDKTTGELKWTKPPYQPNGISAESDNPNTWVSFEEAKAAYETGCFSGIGYVVTADAETTSRHPALVDDGISGVDLDHVVDPETGRIEPCNPSWISSIPTQRFPRPAPGCESSCSPSYPQRTERWGTSSVTSRAGI